MTFRILSIAVLSILLCGVLTRGLAELCRLHFTVVSIAAAAPYAALVATRSASPLLDSLSVLAVGAVAGTLLASIVRTRQTLFAFAIAAAVVDVISFIAGPTHQLLTGPKQVWMLRLLAVTTTHFAVIGIGELLLFACMATALNHIGLRWIPALGAPAVGLLVAVFVGIHTSGLPAVPFLSAATIAACLLSARSHPPIRTSS